MASQTITHRLPKDDPTPAPAASASDPKIRMDWKLAMAKRGVRSLVVAVAIPATATAASISLAGASLPVEASPSWNPPMWAFHMGSLFMSSLLLSAWLVWAEGGFHRRGEALPLYLAELVAVLLWAPLLFRTGAVWQALAVCVAHLVVLLLLSQCFRRVNPNPMAADLSEII